MTVLRMQRPWKHPESDVYYFRKAVPDDLRRDIGWEVKRSLKTKDPDEARRRHAEESVRVDEEWAELRRRKVALSAPPLAELDAATIKSVGEAYYAFLLEEDDDRRLAGFAVEGSIPDAPTPTFEEHAAGQADFEATARHGWARGEVDVFYMSEVDEVLAWPEFGLRLGPSSPSRKLIARELQAAVIRAGKAKSQRNDGEPVETPPYPSVTRKSAEVTQGAQPLLTLFADWWKEAEKTGTKPSTHDNYRNTVNKLVAFLGHDDAAKVTPEDVIRFKDHRLTDDFGDEAIRSGSNSVLDKAEAVLEKGKRATNVLSFMAPVNTYLQRWAAKASLARLINEASGATSANMQRLRAMGLSDDMAAKVQDHLRSTVVYRDSDIGVGKIKDLNLDAWKPEVRNAFENTLWRMSRRLVQENDLGQTNMFFSSELGKMLFQFRAFMLASWSKQFLYGINMRDWESFVGFTASSALGAAVYVGQTHLQSLGRSDRQKFLDDRLSPSKIGSASFQRAGWASFMPMGVDFGAELLGFDPLFDTRVSGLSSKWLGNPTVDLVDKFHKGMGGVAATATRSSSFTQPDARRLLAVTPFQNFLPWMNVYNAFISNLPEREARRSH